MIFVNFINTSEIFTSVAQLVQGDAIYPVAHIESKQ